MEQLVMDWKMMTMRKINQGEVWLFSLDPVVGHEQAKTRPCLVVSDDRMNHGNSQLIMVVPLTTRNKGIPWHIEIDKIDGQMPKASFIMCDQLRTVSLQRIQGSCWGRASWDAMKKVQSSLRLLLSL